MAKIPKNVSERLIRTVSKFQKVLKIAKDRDVNESDTVSIISDMLAEVFGFDKVKRDVGSECNLLNEIQKGQMGTGEANYRIEEILMPNKSKKILV